jgi:hypothetical protein
MTFRKIGKRTALGRLGVIVRMTGSLRSPIVRYSRLLYGTTVSLEMNGPGHAMFTIFPQSVKRWWPFGEISVEERSKILQDVQEALGAMGMSSQIAGTRTASPEQEGTQSRDYGAIKRLETGEVQYVRGDHVLTLPPRAPIGPRMVIVPRDMKWDPPFEFESLSAEETRILIERLLTAEAGGKNPDSPRTEP